MEEESPNFHHSHDHHHHVPAEVADHGLLRRRSLNSISGNGLCYYNYWSHNNDCSNSSSFSVGGEATDPLISEFSFPKSSEPLTSTTLGIAELHLGPSLAEGNDHGDDRTRVLREKLMLKASFLEKNEDYYDHGDSLVASRDYSGIFGNVYPSTDFSKDRRSAAVLLDCYEVSAPAAFDFLRDKNSPRLNDDVGEIALDDNTPGLLRGNLPPDPHIVLHPSTRHHRTEIAASSFTGKKSWLDSKRPNYSLEAKVDREVGPKKKKVEVEVSPPWKARKEKLGDKVAALQQLVAPFGKTDTASVLMEAIGYIKFLQNQVQTLCEPYMKASPEENSGPASRPGLQPRGLCLAPLSCTTLVASDGAGGRGGGGGYWPPVPYYGGT